MNNSKPKPSHPHLSICKQTFCLITAFCCFIAAQNCKAQQLFNYTQYMHNLVPVNTAAAVLEQAESVNVVIRRQLTGIEGAPSTFIFNGQLPIESIGATAGLVLLNDQFAIERLTEINAFLAKRIRLAQGGQYLSVSLNLGIRRYTANYSSLDATDPQFRNDVRESRPNIGFGILYHSARYYLGVAVPEFTTRSLGQASLVDNSFFSSHYNFSGAYLLGDEGGEVRVKPSVLASYAKDLPLVCNFSTTLYLKSTLGLGANYRTNKEMAGILSYTSDLLKVGYSYQFGTVNNNVVNGFRNNTHEITFTYRFGNNLGNRSLL
ncbi:PorP/SprF family type IX secretion system membrane protein [Mucilaginibacter sp. PAMB04168]|uniref:PorP/SprF family type IX secretion system membrane protein n=1 Tax=Mucilaginibacter sp. PAMB04168 TaxID=3138567 RepID=UPI0031F6AC27